MPALALKLTARQVKAIYSLRWRAKKIKDARLFVRCQGILAVNAGVSIEKSASILGVHPNSIRGWIKRVKDHGVDGLKTKKYPGAKPKLSLEQKKSLSDIVRDSPEKAGFDTGVWTGPLIQKLIKERFGQEYHVSQVRRILHKLGFSVQYPRVQLSKADAKKQKEWLNTELPAIKKKSTKRTAS